MRFPPPLLNTSGPAGSVRSLLGTWLASGSLRNGRTLFCPPCNPWFPLAQGKPSLFPPACWNLRPTLSRCQRCCKVSGSFHWGHPWASTGSSWAWMSASNTCFRANLEKRVGPGAWGLQPTIDLHFFWRPPKQIGGPFPKSHLALAASPFQGLALPFQDWSSK